MSSRLKHTTIHGNEEAELQRVRPWLQDIETAALCWLYALYMHWLRLYQEPFKGVTVDGRQRTIFNEMPAYAISGV